MATEQLETQIQKLIAPSGVTLNGPKPFDPQIHNPDTYKSMFIQGNLGLGEAYMKGWWDCQHLDEFFNKLLSAKIYAPPVGT